MLSHIQPVMKLIAGFVFLLIGIVLALPGIPGPGILIMLLGLWLLSDHFVWARKTLGWAKRKAVRLRRTVRKKDRMNRPGDLCTERREKWN